MEKYKVIDNGNLQSDQKPYLGKKGVVLDVEPDTKRLQFKDGEIVWFANEKLKPVKKRHKFDLDRALNGDDVVTRDGCAVSGIVIDKGCNQPVWGSIGHINLGFYENGRYCMNQKVKSKNDLFMKHPATESVKTDLPQYAAELISQAVPNPVADGIDRLKSQLGSDPQPATVPSEAYYQLKETFTHLLQALYERSNKGDCLKWEGMFYWNKRAGLES